MTQQIFDDIWFLPNENTWSELNPLAYRDKGRLIVSESSLEFRGNKATLTVTGISRVSFERQGRDFINKWVKIEYGNPVAPSTVFFADGGMLGWKGIFGGTKKLFRVISRLN